MKQKLLIFIAVAFHVISICIMSIPLIVELYVRYTLGRTIFVHIMVLLCAYLLALCIIFRAIGMIVSGQDISIRCLYFSCEDTVGCVCVLAFLSVGILCLWSLLAQNQSWRDIFLLLVVFIMAWFILPGLMLAPLGESQALGDYLKNCVFTCFISVIVTSFICLWLIGFSPRQYYQRTGAFLKLARAHCSKLVNESNRSKGTDYLLRTDRTLIALGKDKRVLFEWSRCVGFGLSLACENYGDKRLMQMLTPYSDVNDEVIHNGLIFYSDCHNGYVGLVDKDARIVVPNKICYIAPCSSGGERPFCCFPAFFGNLSVLNHFIGKTSQHKLCDNLTVWRFWDSHGMLSKSCYRSLSSFFGGLACAINRGKNQKVGIIDNNGRWIVKPKYDVIARVRYDESLIEKLDLENFDMSRLDGLGFIAESRWRYLDLYDSSGRLIMSHTRMFDGYKVFSNDEYTMSVKIKGKWGLINKFGQWIIKPVAKNQNELNHIKRMKFIPGPTRLGRFYGYKKAGRWLIPPIFDDLKWAGNDVFIYRINAWPVGRSKGYITSNGVLLTEPVLEIAGRFHEGVAAMRKQF